jgi:hypothetical protein
VGYSRGALQDATGIETATSVCNAINEPRRDKPSFVESEPTREMLLEMLREELEKEAKEKRELEKNEEMKKDLEEKLKVNKDRIKTSRERVHQLIDDLAKNRGQ